MLDQNSSKNNRSHPPAPVFIHGIPAGAPDEELKKTITRVILETTDNLSWLSPGETVLLKPALNSPDLYPATTHPLSLHATAELLLQRGAKVIAADQSGVEFVVMGPQGVVKGSSKENYMASRMAEGSSLRFESIEAQDWQTGFVHFKPGAAPSWPDGFFYTKWIRDVRHIINLPRLSTHVQGGVTLGFKNMVGFLREDSRLQFHADGPFYSYIRFCARKAKLHPHNDHMNAFFQKITEIQTAFREKLRLTLFTATQAQVTLGPNKYMVPIGKMGIGEAYRVTPPTSLVFAAADPVAAEAVALAFLTILFLSARIPFFNRVLDKLFIFFNGQVKQLGKQPIRENAFIKHAVEIGLGSDRIDLQFADTPETLQQQLKEQLAGFLQ